MSLGKLRTEISALREKLGASASDYCACPPVFVQRLIHPDGTVTEQERPEVCAGCGKGFDPERISVIEINIKVVEPREV